MTTITKALFYPCPGEKEGLRPPRIPPPLGYTCFVFKFKLLCLKHKHCTPLCPPALAPPERPTLVEAADS